MSVKADSEAGEFEWSPSHKDNAPATEIAAEKKGFSHGTVELYNATGDLIRIPTASRDPNGMLREVFTLNGSTDVLTPTTLIIDPLRIPEWRKWAILVTFCLCAYTSGPQMCCRGSI